MCGLTRCSRVFKKALYWFLRRALEALLFFILGLDEAFHFLFFKWGALGSLFLRGALAWQLFFFPSPPYREKTLSSPIIILARPTLVVRHLWQSSL